MLGKKFWAGLIKKNADGAEAGDIELFIRIFKEYFFRFRKTYAVIGVLIGVAAATSAAPVWLVRDVVDGIFVQKQADMVWPLFWLIFLVFVLKGLSTYWQTVLSSRISNAMVADVQKRMFQHILKQRVVFFNQQGSDELLMRFNQGAAGFHSLLSTVLVNGTRDLVTLLILLGTMVVLDPLLTFLSFVVTPVVFVGINLLLVKLKNIAKKEMEGLAQLNKQVRETVQGITVIKSFNLEKPLQKKTSDLVSYLETRRNRIASLQAAPVPLLDTLAGIAVGLAILYAGSRTVTGTYDSKNFVAFALALVVAAEHARRLSQLPVKLKAAFVAVNMVFAILNDDQNEKSGDKVLKIENREIVPFEGAEDKPLIQFEDVSFSYEPTTPILSGFNLDVHKGDVVALVGPSGAGKSTVLKLLLKLYDDYNGKILINGDEQSDLNLESLRDAMSFVGQTNYIFSGSIKDNLTLQNDDIEMSIIEDACRKVGLHDYIAGLPEKYETDVGELGSMISGGQAQRLNMARAIIKDSPILLLDEVTSALDAENEQLIKDYVQSQVGKKTIIVIAHRLSTIQDATRIALLDKGKVVDVGRHEELLASNDYYEKIVALQFAQ